MNVDNVISKFMKNCLEMEIMRLLNRFCFLFVFVRLRFSVSISFFYKSADATKST